MYFRNYALPKAKLDKCNKCAEYPWTKKMVNGPKHCWNHFYHIYWSLWRQLSLKKSILVVCKILRLFVNTSTAYDKSSVLNREYFMQLINMQLSQKQITFSELFSAFLKSILNFEHIQTKMMAIMANVFQKLRTSKNVVRSI